ncbi:MAG: HTTM domain-containing protein [Bacteroidota bacterium]
MKKILTYLSAPADIAPLAVFRALFGAMMAASVVRFWANGWIQDMYITPKYFFTYYGFEWVRPLDETGMYLLFGAMFLSAIGIMLGSFYRFSAVAFFLTFTYVELIDKTNYLNHYYFVSIIAFLLTLVPANRAFSLDAFLKPSLKTDLVPRWTVDIFKLQLGLVYFFAGVAKLHPDWLIDAMPLRIWLPAKAHLPLIGQFLDYAWVAYAFSWFGAVYDLTIPFFLLKKQTRPYAYVAVVSFHVMTRVLFPIGMFPFIMIISTLIYFSSDFHRKIIEYTTRVFKSIFKAYFINKNSFKSPPYQGGQRGISPDAESPFVPLKKGDKSVGFKSRFQPIILSILAAHFVLQLALPFRYALYPGNLFWTEQGFRFSWRVMLMEKYGNVTFHIRDKATGRAGEAMNLDYLTPQQEKMMASQPDMILQFAHFLKGEYAKKGIGAEVRAEGYATLNGRGSRPFINPDVDLTQERESFKNKKWVLPFTEPNHHASR